MNDWFLDVALFFLVGFLVGAWVGKRLTTTSEAAAILAKRSHKGRKPKNESPQLLRDPD